MSTIDVFGLSFVEFSGKKPELLRALFSQMGLRQYQNHADQNITLHQEGDIRFISNPSEHGNVKEFRDIHERGASAMGFKVENSAQAIARAVALGAEEIKNTNYPIPAIRGVGHSLIYFVDEQCEISLFNEFNFVRGGASDSAGPENLLLAVDHLTHNLYPGGIQKYRTFYNTLFGFQSLRTFDISGKSTGLLSEVVASKCGRIIIPLNETKDDKSQIAEYLREYNGEGIQHIALRTENIYESVEFLQNNGIEFQDTPDTYYEILNSRLPEHGEPIEVLREKRILVDGGDTQGGGYLLQIFTKNSIGPIFFEYIQRKGNNGFGEGNFQALFESIELEQQRRGVI